MTPVILFWLGFAIFAALLVMSALVWDDSNAELIIALPCFTVPVVLMTTGFMMLL